LTFRNQVKESILNRYQRTAEPITTFVRNYKAPYRCCKCLLSQPIRIIWINAISRYKRRSRVSKRPRLYFERI